MKTLEFIRIFNQPKMKCNENIFYCSFVISALPSIIFNGNVICSFSSLDWIYRDAAPTSNAKSIVIASLLVNDRQIRLSRACNHLKTELSYFGIWSVNLYRIEEAVRTLWVSFQPSPSLLSNGFKTVVKKVRNSSLCLRKYIHIKKIIKNINFFLESE